MGRASSITPEQGTALLDAIKEGLSMRQAAKRIGVDRSAVARYLAGLGSESAPLLHRPQVLELAGSSLWDTRTALDENYERALDLVEKLEAGIIETDGEYASQTPIAVHVAALREVREHIKTSMGLMKLLVSVDEVRKFQQSVVEAIGEADEPTRQRLLAKLRARRALGPTLI